MPYISHHNSILCIPFYLFIFSILQNSKPGSFCCVTNDTRVWFNISILYGVYLNFVDIMVDSHYKSTFELYCPLHCLYIFDLQARVHIIIGMETETSLTCHTYPPSSRMLVSLWLIMVAWFPITSSVVLVSDSCLTYVSTMYYFPVFPTVLGNMSISHFFANPDYTHHILTVFIIIYIENSILWMHLIEIVNYRFWLLSKLHNATN
jgi:hypothetical protein